MGREVLLRQELYQRSPLLSLVRDPGKLRMKLVIGVGRGRVRVGVGAGVGWNRHCSPLKNHGEGGAGYHGNPPISSGEDIQDLPWEEECFIPLALSYLSFRKSHWERKGQKG